MEVTAQYLGDSKFEVAARAQRVGCDQPRDNGGRGVGRGRAPGAAGAGGGWGGAGGGAWGASGG